ncbi:MAG: hypothetical protein ACRC20_07415 [Segniliparus sp.]|uniref:hypothetical protein n=1 Tax=Segniliparus sp. TaxID=2804064 RepID=UPI003F2B8116
MNEILASPDTAYQAGRVLGRILCAGTVVFVFAVGLVGVWRMIFKKRRTTPPDLAQFGQRLAQMRQSAALPGRRLVVVEHIQKSTKHGSDARVRDYETGEPFDAWFRQDAPATGSLAVITGSFEHDESHGRQVFHVGDAQAGSGVLDQLTAVQLQAALLWPDGGL